MKNPKLFLLKYLLILSFSTFLVALFAKAWQAPTANPPSEDLDELLTTSDQPQSKLGDLNIGPGLKYWITKLGDSFALKNDAGEIKFVVGQDGNVGIGTTTPQYKLDVQGQINASQGLCINKDCRSSWAEVGGYWSANGDNIYNTNSGNVGIGTTDVTAKLKVTNLNEDQAALLVQQVITNPTSSFFMKAIAIEETSDHDYAYSVQQTSDGGYIVAGEYHFEPGNSDLLLLKFDNSGNPSWARRIGGPDSDWAYDIAKSVQQTLDGGYIVAGETYSFGAGYNDVFLLKFDSSGNPSWIKTIGGSGHDWAASVQQTSDGGYIVVGQTGSFGSANYSILLLKLDSSGNLSWAKAIGGSGRDYAYSVQQTSDGGYIVAGFTDSFGAGSYDVFLLKFDSSGNLSWAKTVGGSEADYAYSVQQTSDGGYIVGGETCSFGAGSNRDIFLFKLDGSGNLSWAERIGEASYDYGGYLSQTSDGGFVVTGETYNFPYGDYNAFLLKLDSSGNLSWAKAIGGSSRDRGYSLQQTSDGGYIIAGFTQSFGAGGKDIFLIKTDSTGNISNCPYISSITPTVTPVSPIVSTVSPSVDSDSGSLTVTSIAPNISSPSPVIATQCSAEESTSELQDILTVSGSGKVGIKTTNPAYTLEVNGSFAATSKNFDIQDPRYNDPHRRLIHSSLEGPEHAVFYRGKARLKNGKAIIKLPDYFEALTRKEGRTVILTCKNGWSPLYVDGEIENGKFVVKTTKDGNPNQEFYWEVKAIRKDVPILIPEQIK